MVPDGPLNGQCTDVGCLELQLQTTSYGQRRGSIKRPAMQAKGPVHQDPISPPFLGMHGIFLMKTSVENVVSEGDLGA